MDWGEFWRGGKFSLWFMLTLVTGAALWPLVPILSLVGQSSAAGEPEQYNWGGLGFVILLGLPLIIAAFFEIMLIGILPSAIGWRLTLPLVAKLKLPAWLGAALSGAIAVGAALGGLYAVSLMTFGIEWLRRLLSPMRLGLELGSPIALIAGPIFASLLLREPFRKNNDTPQR